MFYIVINLKRPNRKGVNMIKYICHNCQDLECETSVCPVCGNRAEILESAVYYCPHCEAPNKISNNNLS